MDMAIFKSTESHIKCMQPHPKKENKIIIYKKWSEEEVFNGLMQCANKLFILAVDAYKNGFYKESLEYYSPIHQIIALDEKDQLKTIKITTESVLYNSYFSSKALKDNELSKDFLIQLIELDYQNPSIYSSISDILLDQGYNEKAFEYLSLGRKKFNNDQGLINYEINLYVKLERTEELIAKLTDNINSNPNFHTYYVIRGTCYQNSNNLILAINDYKSALVINPDELTALNNISSCFLVQTEPIILKMNALNINQTSKYNKLKIEVNSLYKKALPYLSRYVELNKEDNINEKVLKEIRYKLEN
jgi:tetratricopeptide (TPR) repeat protein